jgi:hypothetical protein
MQAAAYFEHEGSKRQAGPNSTTSSGEMSRW